MDKAWIVFGCTVAYIIITTVVGMWSVKTTKDTDSFMTAKHQMSAWVVGILLMSEFIGPGATVGTAQGGFEKGLAVAWNSSTLAIGYWLYSYFLAPKMNALGEYTISGALAKHYGANVRMLVSVTMAIALTTVNVAAFTGGAAALSALLHVSIEQAIFIIAICATLNVAFGGIKGVGIANIIHASFKYLGLIIIAGTAWVMIQDKPILLDKIPAAHFSLVDGVGLPQVIAWVIANVGAIFSTQYVLQSISSLPSPADARKATIIAGLAIFPIGFISAYIGVLARGIFPDIKSVMALPAFFDLMNPWLVGICAAAMIAATFVTILACQLGATALIMKDFYVPLMKPNDRQNIWATRIMAIVIGFLPIPFALFVPGMIKTFFFARALRTAITILVLFMFYKPHMATQTGGMVALVLSVIGTVAWMLLDNPWGIDNIYIALVTPAVVMCIDHLIRKSRQTEKAEVGN
ncbi:sodium:solute symporter family protein [Sporomusa aerivorans]|uniref:sodium:solute symporter family protein n=1 Tax=Sporomusa aerivorans TaxID=204936 RepID=UPI00352AF6AF